MTGLIAIVDKSILIPPHFKNLTGDTEFTTELKAGVAKDVPDHIAEYYAKNHPRVFRIASRPIVKTTIEKLTEADTGPEEEEFEPLTFLEENLQDIGTAIKQHELKRPQINELAKTLKLSKYLKQSDDRVIERIVNDIEVKRQHEEKMSKIAHE